MTLLYVYTSTVDPLLLLCGTSGSTTQVKIDCQVSRPAVESLCSFDGGHQHKCKCDQNSWPSGCDCTLSLYWSFHMLIVMATGEWPMIVNVRSGFSAGNHSVVIMTRDSLGLTANGTVSYLLEEEEQSKQNRM